MLKTKSITNSTVPSFVYLHIVHDYDDLDKLLFCDEEQHFLHKVPWLIMKTDNYFIPSLFLMPSFEQELNDLFPKKDKVFHFLAYKSECSTIDTEPGPFQHVLDQILAYILKENILHDVNRGANIDSSSGTPKSKAVLMTSLSSGHFENVRDIYWEYPTGEVIGIYQPSHEGYQQTKADSQPKSLGRNVSLKLNYVLVTSSWSTFGYVAQGLGGLKHGYSTLRRIKRPQIRLVGMRYRLSHVSMLLPSMTVRLREELTLGNLFHMLGTVRI
ncbi:hypothetical protein TSUD_05690 [Trifolium subterraneum]|uniref:Fucosyltransferase n=1 Tax=Trifolium subterraneum TaxID=3900 RepID=A0A2Z6MBA7_TRISU|nr:hypothetical protein TSUD_05690 [Trifolium subterraneum]